MEQGKSSRVSSAPAGRCPRTMEAQEVTAALQLLAGAPSRAFIATACALTGADWVTCWGLWLSRSSEAGTNPGKERGRREKQFGKNVSRKPQGPAGEECQSQVPPRCAEQIALGSDSRQRFLFSGSRLALSDKRIPCYCILPRRYGSVHPVLLSSSSKYTQE